MVVGVMQVEISIEWSRSLKDKRSVVRSLRDVLHRHHLVSVAEVADQDLLNRAMIGVSMVSNSGAVIGACFDRVLERIRSVHECEVVWTGREILHGSCGSYSAHEDEELVGDLDADLVRRGELTIEAMETLD